MDESAADNLSKFVNVLFVLAPTRSARVFFGTALQRPELWNAMSQVLEQCRDALAVRVPSNNKGVVRDLPLGVFGMKALFNETVGDNSNEKPPYESLVKIVRNVCRQVVKPNTPLKEPIVSPTEFITGVLFEAPESSDVFTLCLSLIGYFADEPARNNNRNYPIEWDSTKPVHVKPSDLVSFVIALHKLISFSSGRIPDAPGVIRKLGEKLKRELSCSSSKHRLFR